MNWPAFQRAARKRNDGQTCLQARNGLKILIRHNKWDARIVEEQFVYCPYLRHFTAPTSHRPVVVDIGAYIGDFTLYCAKELQAKVIAYEPVAENFAMMVKNLGLNPQQANLVTPISRGVSSTEELTLNIVSDGQEIHASSIWYAGENCTEQRRIACDTLSDVLNKNNLDSVDLLKIDCEGGEYDLISATPPDTLRQFRSIVYEWHMISGWQKKHRALEELLEQYGYVLQRKGQIVFATIEA